MTTIAANRACMAADSKLCDDDVSFTVKKIVEIGDTVVGCAGDNVAIRKFLRWLENGKDLDDVPKFTKDESVRAIILTPAGLFLSDESCTFDEVKEDCCAIGSGRQSALTAMRVYKDTPENAIKAACEVDASTGGPVDVIYLRR